MNVPRVMGWPTPQKMDQRVKPSSRFSVSLKDNFWELNQGRQVYCWPPSLPMTNSPRISPR